MITVLFVNMCAETVIRRYNTNSFDEALKLLLKNVATNNWHYCGEESDDEIVTAFMVKSTPIEASELPTKSISP